MRILREYLSAKVKPTVIVVPSSKELNEIVHNEIERLGNDTDLNHIDTSKVTSMQFTFYRTDFNGDVSKWNVENVTDFTFMFAANEKFDGYLGDWNMHSAILLDSMFNGATNFTGDGLEKWKDKLGNCKQFKYTFQNCKHLVGKQFENWILSKDLENVECMFQYCTELDCDLSKWTLKRGTQYHHMLYCCNKMSIFHYPKYAKGRNQSID